MRRQDLREQTRKAAIKREHKMGTRLSKGEKKNAKRMVLRYCTRGIDRYKIPVTARSPTLPH